MVNRRTIIAAFLSLISVAVFGLEFGDFLRSIAASHDAETAELVLEAARSQLAILEYRGDLNLSLQPVATAVTPTEGPFADEVTLSASLSASLPLGISSSRLVSVASARDAVDAAESALERAADDAFVRLYTLYFEARTAQAQRSVLSLERDAAKALSGAARLLYESGRISMSELARAEEAERTVETALREGELAVRLSWLELAYAAGLDPMTTPELEPLVLSFGELPKPPELTDWALLVDDGVLAVRRKIAGIEAEIEALGRFDLAATIRANLQASSHAVSVTYNTETTLLSGSYSLPIVTFGDDGSGGGGSSWSLGLSVSLATSLGSADSRELEAARIALRMEEAKLSAIGDLLALVIRGRYQEFLLASEAVTAAERNLAKAADNLAVATDRYERGQLTAAELLEAEALLARAGYQLERAEGNEVKIGLLVAQSAGYLRTYLDTINTGVIR